LKIKYRLLCPGAQSKTQQEPEAVVTPVYLTG
jgi:hypothetical protein